MKLIKSTTILAAASVLLMAASASAKIMTHKQAVDTRGGSPVMTKFGDCVITKWDAKGKTCTSITSEMRTIYFGFNSSALTPAAKTKLNALSKALKSRNVTSVSIIGFADEIGTESYNQRLSEKRANAVAAYLRGRGIKVMGQSEVRGLGETSSKSDCASTKGKSMQSCLWRDRRVEVEITN